MRAVLLTSAALLLLACPSPPVCVGISSAGTGAMPRQETWAYDSAPVEVPFEVGFSDVGCGSSQPGPRPDSVVAEVLGPSNARLPSEVVNASLGAAQVSATATVRFEPSEGPGTYLVTATFLPVGGRVSVTMLVIGDRRKEPPDVATFASCSEFSVMPSGVTVCDGVARWADGRTETLCAGAAHFNAENTLWCYDGDALAAFAEEGGTFRDRGRLTLGFGYHFLAEAQRVIAAQAYVSPPTLQRIDLLETGLQRGAPTLLSTAPGTLARDGDVLYVADSDPGTNPNTGFAEHDVCAYDARGPVLSLLGCQGLAGRVLAAAGKVLLTESNGTVRAFAGSPLQKLLLTDTLAVPSDWTPLGEPEDIFSGNWLQLYRPVTGPSVVRVVNGALRMEQFPELINGARSRPDHTWGLGTTSTTNSMSNTVRLWKNDP